MFYNPRLFLHMISIVFICFHWNYLHTIRQYCCNLYLQGELNFVGENIDIRPALCKTKIPCILNALKMHSYLFDGLILILNEICFHQFILNIF